MRPIRLALILLAVLAFSWAPAHAQRLEAPNGLNVTGNAAVSGTMAVTGATTLTGALTATGGVVNGCNWSVTTYGGAAPQTSNVACLASFSHVSYQLSAGGSPTAVITPGQAGTTPNVVANCAITAPGSTTVGCLAPAGQATTIVYGFAW